MPAGLSTTTSPCTVDGRRFATAFDHRVPAVGSRAGERSWWWAVVGICALGALVRLVVAWRVVPDRLGLDATWFVLQSDNLRSGRGFVDPASVFRGEVVPTAGFGPGYPAALGAWQTAVGDGVVALRCFGATIGAVSIGLTAALGRRLAGPGVGLIAAAVTAASPAMWAADAAPMTDGLATALVLATTVLLLRGRTGPRQVWWLAGAGIVAGAAVLTRADAAVVVAAVVATVVVWPERRRWRRALMSAVIVVVCAAGVVIPWVARNAEQLGVATLTTSSSATALAGANCDQTYRGPLTGGWAFECIDEPSRVTLGEVAWSRQISARARSYAREHPWRLVTVVAPARAARLWGWWDPRQLADLAEPESRNRTLWLWSWPVSLALQAAAVIGVVRARRSGARTGPLVAVAVAVTVVAVVVHGNPRLRAPAEPFLAIGAAIALAPAISRLARRDPGRVA
jgi:4-amino-4-deoxy-L-arabinose transferase-like glycosyltransferase